MDVEFLNYRSWLPATSPYNTIYIESSYQDDFHKILVSGMPRQDSAEGFKSDWAAQFKNELDWPEQDFTCFEIGSRNLISFQAEQIKPYLLNIKCFI